MAIPPLAQTAMKVDQAVARLQKLQSTVSVKNAKDSSFQNKSRYRDGKTTQAKRFHELAGMAEASESIGDHWRRWSLPAEFVHQAISEIKLANDYAKEVAAIMANAKKEKTQNAMKCAQISPRETGIEDTGRGIPSRLENKAVTLDSMNGTRIQNSRMMTRKALEREEAGKRRREALANEKFPKRRGKYPPKTVQRFNKLTETLQVKKASQNQIGRSHENGEGFSHFPSTSSPRKMAVRQQHGLTKNKLNSNLKGPAIQTHVSFTAGVKRCPATLMHSSSPTRKTPSNWRALRPARVSNSPQSPPMAIGKFAFSVTEIPTTHRPWSLTPGRSSKPVVMFPNPAFVPCRSHAKPRQFTSLPASINSDSSKKLSPLGSLRDVKITSSVPKSPLLSIDKKLDLLRVEPQSDKKAAHPQVTPSAVPVTETKQGWFSKRLSMTPPRNIFRTSALDKRDFSSVKSLPSLITCLPARRKENCCLQSHDVTATAKYINGAGKFMTQMEEETIFPLPIPPALHAEQLREAQRNLAVNCAQSTPKTPVSCSRQFRPLDGNLTPKFQSEGLMYPSRGKENNAPVKMEHERKGVNLKDHALPFSGCSATVWPVLRKSWSFGNEKQASQS